MAVVYLVTKFPTLTL